jgi:hypothetical protein
VASRVEEARDRGGRRKSEGTSRVEEADDRVRRKWQVEAEAARGCMTW